MSTPGTCLTRDSRSVLEVVYRFEFDPPPDQLVEMLQNVECTVSAPEPVSPVPEYLIRAMLAGGRINVRAGLALLRRLALIEPSDELVAFGEWKRPDGSTVRAILAWENPRRPPDLRHVDAVDVYLGERPLMFCEFGRPNVEPVKCWRLTPAGVTAALATLTESSRAKPIVRRGRRREYDPAADEKLVGDWRASGMKQAQYERERSLEQRAVERAVDRVRQRRW